MFSEKDKKQIVGRGSNLVTVENQIDNFKKGFPFLKIEKAATIGSGIIELSESDKTKYITFFENKLSEGLQPLKFVPASGAASRMFKALFEAKSEFDKGLSENEILEKNKDVSEFISEIQKFAFADELKKKITAAGKTVSAQTLLNYLLTGEGLNYGSLPKGLLAFHKYANNGRTPFEEHLVEGSLYSTDKNNKIHLHFTVSKEHQEGFTTKLQEILNTNELTKGNTFDVQFSQQKPSTDTIAVDPNNEPFKNDDGSLLFRPGGHGALLENLNDLNSDIIFIKNIDNVVPDKLKKPTIDYKKALAGVLLKTQERIFRYQKEFNEKHYTAFESAFLAEAANFLETQLNTIPPENQYYTEKETLYNYLKEKFNRPTRVCGMVKNEGEPGGGPFWARNADHTISLQIVESSQIDFTNAEQNHIAKHATHFNPVDLVCAVKNYKGEKFNLLNFSDPLTGFISEKSKDGKILKAQELPGLWNGAMSNWNTLFVEVPIETFNPVKTVNDLLRQQHQP